jgi:replicative DNA helicase
MSVQRQLIERNLRSIELARAGAGTTAELINACQAEVMAVDAGSVTDRLREGFESVNARVFTEGEAAANGGTLGQGLTLGYEAFDSQTLGLQPGDLVAVIAQAKIGKTAFVLDIMDHVAVELQRNTIIFEREMTAKSLFLRMLCARAGMTKREFLSWMWSKLQRDAVMEAKDKLYTNRIQVVDMTKPTPTPSLIRRECRAMKREQGLDLIVVDFLELMEPDRFIGDERVKLDTCIRELKGIAGEFGAVAIALCQVGREIEKREDRRPQLRDIRGSGGIAAALDWAFGLYNETYYARMQSPEKFKDDPGRRKEEEVEINTLASRSDASPCWKAGFVPAFTQFYDLGINGPEF